MFPIDMLGINTPSRKDDDLSACSLMIVCPVCGPGLEKPIATAKKSSRTLTTLKVLFTKRVYPKKTRKVKAVGNKTSSKTGNTVFEVLLVKKDKRE